MPSGKQGTCGRKSSRPEKLGKVGEEQIGDNLVSSREIVPGRGDIDANHSRRGRDDRVEREKGGGFRNIDIGGRVGEEGRLSKKTCRGPGGRGSPSPQTQKAEEENFQRVGGESRKSGSPTGLWFHLPLKVSEPKKRSRQKETPTRKE